MYCSNCGSKLGEDAKFCASCGKKLGGEQVDSAQQSPQIRQEPRQQGFREPESRGFQNPNYRPNYGGGNYPPPRGKSKAPLIALALALPLIFIIGAFALFNLMPRDNPEDTVRDMFTAFESADIDRFMELVVVDYDYFIDDEDFKREIEREMRVESENLKAEIGSNFLKHIELVTISKSEDRATVRAIYKEEIIEDYLGEDTFDLKRVDGKWLIVLD